MCGFAEGEFSPRMDTDYHVAALEYAEALVNDEEVIPTFA